MTDQDLVTRIAVLEERLKASEDAKRLQAIEYERRLDVLNHAHEEASKDKEKFLEKDTYEKSEGELRVWRRGIDSWKDVQAGKDASKAANLALLLAGLSLLIGIFGIYLRMFGH